MTIYFELDDDEYSKVLQKADEMKIHPNEYVKQMIIQDEFSVKVPFSLKERSLLNIMILKKYGDVSAEALIREWTLKLLKNDMEG